MPVEPTYLLLQKLLGLNAPPPVNGPPNPIPMEPAQSTMPSWMRTGIEGGADMGMGMMGMGPSNRMGAVGEIMGAGLPFMKFLKGLKAAPIVEEGIPALDDVGRLVGFEKKIDPAFEAHVRSSVGKFEAPKSSNLKAGRQSSLEPSQDQIEEMMKKYKK